MFTDKSSKDELQSVCTWEFHCNECGRDFELNEKYVIFELTNNTLHPCCLSCKPRIKNAKMCEEQIFCQALVQSKAEENAKFIQNIMLLRKNFLEQCPWFSRPTISVSIRPVKTESTPDEKRRLRRRAVY